MNAETFVQILLTDVIAFSLLLHEELAGKNVDLQALDKNSFPFSSAAFQAARSLISVLMVVT
jgi:hypothetical protein